MELAFLDVEDFHAEISVLIVRGSARLLQKSLLARLELIGLQGDDEEENLDTGLGINFYFLHKQYLAELFLKAQIAFFDSDFTLFHGLLGKIYRGNQILPKRLLARVVEILLDEHLLNLLVLFLGLSGAGAQLVLALKIQHSLIHFHVFFQRRYPFELFGRLCYLFHLLKLHHILLLRRHCRIFILYWVQSQL